MNKIEIVLIENKMKIVLIENNIEIALMLNYNVKLFYYKYFLFYFIDRIRNICNANMGWSREDIKLIKTVFAKV